MLLSRFPLVGTDAFVDVDGDDVGTGAGGWSELDRVGRPRFGLSASSASERRYAGLQSAHALNSSLSELSIFRPTLISTVDLDGLAVTLKGPVQCGWRPLALCCLV